MSNGLNRFLGGSPLAVLGKLILLSILIGVVLSTLGLDTWNIVESLRRLLYHSGYEVAVAYTGQEGLRAAKRMRPDVVLCDIGLPDSNGFVVAAALREDPQTCDARLIAVTAYGQDEDRRRAREAGFDLHLVKPVDPEVLLRRLQS